MKKVSFLLFTCLLLVALILPACGGGEQKGDTIKIGIIGPMEYIQGEHQWWGAEMAADEINAANGVLVGDKKYMIELIKADSNEILSTTDASAAMEKLITVDGAQFVLGGFRTEAVFPMQEIAMDYETIFICCGAATLQLNTPVYDDYERYKYFFRATPFASTHLVTAELMHIGMVGDILKEESGIQRPLKVAICAEGAEWADGMVNALNALIPSRLGMEVVGIWRPSPTATDLTAEMIAIEASGADIIATTISGPLGIPYARSWGELEIPAASVGINVEAQSLGFWDATQEFGNYETTSSSYAANVEQTPLTKNFIEGFMAKTGQVPTYNAGTYDAMYMLKDAIQRAGTLDVDAVIAELEKWTGPNTVAPAFVFTGMDSPLKNPHDVTFGPGNSTGLAVQWQDGELVGVWPNPDYATDEEWAKVNYKGIVKWKAPPALLEKLKAEAATEPAAPAEPTEPTEPAAPAAGVETSFKAKTYANDEYGFSIQYPDRWEERPELVTTDMHVAGFGVPAFIPGVVICRFDTTEPITADWITQSFQDLGNQNFKVLSDLEETTLPDGTAATVYEASYVSATGYEILSYQVDADEGDNRIRLILFTIDAFDPYADNKATFEEVAQTLTFE